MSRSIESEDGRGGAEGEGGVMETSFRPARKISPPTRENTSGVKPSMGLLKNSAFSRLVSVSGDCQRFERMTIDAPDNEPIAGKLAGGSSGSRDLRTDDVQGPLVTMRLSHGTATFWEVF